MAAPIDIAVVGHTNVGKTSLLRTLVRRRDFGVVSDSPGTTRHVESIDLHIDGASAVRYHDTPGLEDSAALLHYLKTLLPDATPLERVRAFLRGPEAKAAFEQEAKVLRTLLACDAAIYVIDCRQTVLPKYRYEIEILAACAKPVMPVLNFSNDPASCAAQWRETLTAYHLHTCVQFDAVAPFMGAERQLYEDLGVLLRERRAQLQDIIDELDWQSLERRRAARELVASLLVSAAAMRRDLSPADVLDAGRKAALLRRFKKDLSAQVTACVQALLAVYGFHPDDAEVDVAPWTEGRWEADLFSAHTLKDASQKLGTGAAVGAAVGLVADVALAGLSLGTGTALGAAVGGLASQGWSQVPRKIANRLRGVEELTLENAVLLVLAGSMVRLCAALDQRGHAAWAKVRVASESASVSASSSPSPSNADKHSSADTSPLHALVTSLAAARSYPRWESTPTTPRHSDTRRSALVEHIAQQLRVLAQP